MKKQDLLTPIGLILGFLLVLYGMSNGDSGLGIFYDLSSIAITVGGSFSALLVTYSLKEIKLFFKLSSKLFVINRYDKTALLLLFRNLSKKVRRNGGNLLSLEDDIRNIDDKYLRQGLELYIDSVPARIIAGVLEVSTQELITSYTTVSKMYKTWGSFAPAFGMVGTLIGLIQMLAGMNSPETIASGMASALITTFYGALLANLILIPLGLNLQNKAESETNYREMAMTGILSLKNGDSTKIMEDKLINFLSTEERLAYLRKSSDEINNSR